MRFCDAIPLGLLAACAATSELGSQEELATATTVKPFMFQISAAVGGPLPQGELGCDVVADTEIDDALAGDDDADADAAGASGVDRTIAPDAGPGTPTTGKGQAKSHPELALTFPGLDFHAQRFANRGNQFSIDPPDQALCAGNGFVLESTNDVLQIFSSSGAAVTGVVDLNTFYGYPAAINRR